MNLVLIIGLLASWAAIILLGTVLYQVILQNGRALLRLEELESRLPEAEEADIPVAEYLGMLPEGFPAPAFSLPDLNGTLHHLSEWRGQRLLLVFFDPASSFCRQLLPYLVSLADDVVPGRPKPVVVSTGELEENRALFDGAGFGETVLLQAGMELATAFKVDGTPMSYVIDADGTIASKLATGVQATMILAGELDADRPTVRARMPGEDQGAATQDEKLRRFGLKVGETAPVFRLPKLDGGELSLLDYRGRPVVVVFSDPDCPPCDELMPGLEAAHRRAPEYAIVIIGRGDIEANRAKAAEFGISFPVALQRHWEISREYGIFAAPVAYLIDEWGVIADDVRVGPEAILEMVNRETQVKR